MRNHQEKTSARTHRNRHQHRRDNACDQNSSSCESVHAIGEIDGVAHEANPKCRQHHKPRQRKHNHIGSHIGRLHDHLRDWCWRIGALEWQVQHGGVDLLRAFVKKISRDHPNTHSEKQFLPHEQAFTRSEFAKPRGEFKPIIKEANSRQPNQHAHANLRVAAVNPIGQQECADQDRGHDQDAAHGGSIGLGFHQLIERLVVELGRVAHFLAVQPTNYFRTGKHGQGE